jgi:DNA-binding beta-propeller fold protein YncE
LQPNGLCGLLILLHNMNWAHLRPLMPLLFGLAAPAPLHAAGARLFKSGPVQITRDGAWVWVANQDNDSITRIDTATESATEFVLSDAGMVDSPRGLSLKEDGSEVWVACHDSDRLYVLSGTDGSLFAQIDLPWGSGPFSVALSRDQQRALVTLHRSAGLAVINVVTRQVTDILQPVYHSPMGIAWTEDGVTAWITHLFAEGEHPQITRVDFSGSRPRVKTSMNVFPSDPRQSSRLIAPYNVAEGGYLTTRGHPAQIPSASGRNQLWLPVQYNNISEDIYTPDSTVQSTIRRLELSTKRIPNGTNDKVILSALHVHDPGGTNRYLGPGWNARVAGPIDIAFSSNGAMTCVVHELSDDLVVLPSNTPLAKPAGSGGLPEIGVGSRPRGLAVSPTADRAYVYNSLSRDVSVVDLTALTELRRIPLNPLTGERFSAEVLRGAKLFHSSADSRISTNHKVACASCHINAEHDGRAWAFHRLPGPHGPREVPSLLGLYQTFGPRDPTTGLGQLHRSGDRDEIQDFEHTFQGINMGGAGFLGTNVQAELGAANAGRSGDLDALAAYLLSLEPIPRSPHRAPDGTLTEAAIRGATFFRGTNRLSKVGDAGCAQCHVPETGFVDFRFHDVGQSRPSTEEELNTRLPLWHVNTPTLVGVWTTQPYNGVAGYAPSIIGVLKDQAARASTATPHGKPNGLTKRQLADLNEFILSIDGNMTGAEVRNARDTIPPRVVRVAPTSLRRIEVWFNESVKSGSVTNTAKWELSRGGGGVVPITSIDWDGQNGDRVSVTAALRPNSQYSLRPVGVILDEADTATGGTANAVDLQDPANTHVFNIGDRLTITLGGSGYENIAVPVHDAAMAGPGLSTWSHDGVWVFPVSGTPRMNTGFVRWGWRQLFAHLTGVAAGNEIVEARFRLQAEMGDAQTIELRRVLLSWSDPPTGGDYNQNPVGGPTWRDHSHPSLRWNLAGAGRLGTFGTNAADYNGTNDLASRVDATIAVEGVNEEIELAGALITDAFRFWFDNPAVDYGYAVRVLGTATHEVKFASAETGLGEHGPVLQLTYLLPQAPRIALVSALPAGTAELTIECQPGRNYDLEGSDNLRAWNLLTSFLSTNANMKVQDSPGGSARQRFYRVLTR